MKRGRAAGQRSGECRGGCGEADGHSKDTPKFNVCQCSSECNEPCVNEYACGHKRLAVLRAKGKKRKEEGPWHCKCGCGQNTPESLAMGHKDRPRNKICACGCGRPSINKWFHLCAQEYQKELKRQRNLKECQCSRKCGRMTYHTYAVGCVNDYRTEDTVQQISKAVSQRWKEGFFDNSIEVRQSKPEYWDNMRLSGIKKRGRKVPRGSKSPLWKGGQNLLDLMRKHIHEAWRRPILERDKFLCQHCGKGGKLHVHHCETTMKDIVLQFIPPGFDKSKLSEDEKLYLIDQVKAYHLDNDIKGISLCPPCHRKEHKRLKAIERGQKEERKAS